MQAIDRITTGTGSKRRSPLRAIVFRALETAQAGDRLSLVVDVLLVSLIVLTVAAVVLESVPSFAARYGDELFLFEVITVSVFSVEYLLRAWSCIERERGDGSLRDAFGRRLRYLTSFHAIVDLLAILPFFLMQAGLFGNADMRFLRAVRLLRVLKLTRYSPALNMLVTAIVENGRSLAAAFFILLTVMLLAASGIYYFERDAQPVDFGSIPAAMWWAFSTLTTVGYGDVTPVTTGGKVFGAAITVVGLGMVALPTGIIASGFAAQLKMRSARFEESARRAWDDGVLSETEKQELERYRKSLGLGRETASQILDAGKVQRMLEAERAGRCPTCGR